MLVDPYFGIDQLRDVARLGNISRVLTSAKLKQRERFPLSRGLAEFEEGRPLEVRIVSSFHDRFLIPGGGGEVLMLGVSLGGMRNNISVITQLGELPSLGLSWGCGCGGCVE